MDNFHHGGCVYPIDVETGIVDGRGFKLGQQSRFLKHPNSLKVMCGFQIPNWENVIMTVCSAAKLMEHIGYIGWDIAVLENGCEIIEANVNYPDSDLVQLNGFSAYEKIKNFLKNHSEDT